MICLYCGEPLKDTSPHDCPSCGEHHPQREPIVGVNHVSQILCALDQLREGNLDIEDFEAAFQRFIELFGQFEEKWRLQEATLAEQLAPSLQKDFGETLGRLDEALRDGYHGIECVESALVEGADLLDLADVSLTGFFKKSCSAAAKLLDDLAALKRKAGESGAFFNLPSV